MHRITVGFCIAALAWQAATRVDAQTPGAPGVVSQFAQGGVAGAQGQASISGTVLNPGGQPIANVGMRARDLLTGRVAGSSSTSGAGQYSILGLPPGSYVIEIVDAGGQIVGTSSFISVAAGTAVTNATIMAASGTLGALSTAASLASLGATTAQSLTVAAAAAGVAGLVVAPTLPTGSPSR